MKPMKSVAQKAGYECLTTGMANKLRCRIHHPLEPIQSTP